jgi:sterol desaturase/sphingolipid hydroxylase (fatty acid hydroxylase superfamily)
VDIPALVAAYFKALSSGFRDFLDLWIGSLICFLLIGATFWWVESRKNCAASNQTLFAYLFPRHLYTHPTAIIAYKNLILSLLLWGPLLGGFTAIGSFAVAHRVCLSLIHTYGTRPLVFSSDSGNILLEILMYMLSASFIYYILHLAMHKVPVLWSIHRVHHSSEALGLPAGFHTHPLEQLMFLPTTLLTSALGGVMLYFLGRDNWSPFVVAYITFHIVWGAKVLGVFLHSQVPLGFGQWNKVLYGPVLHQIHHSAELRHRDKNLGDAFYISIWDWMFGTLYIPAKDEKYRWGLNDEEYGANNPHLNLRAFYLEPFQYAWNALATSLLVSCPEGPCNGHGVDPDGSRGSRGKTERSRAN